MLISATPMNNSPTDIYNEILPITDAILGFKPLIACFLACFYLFSIDSIGFTCLLQPFLAE